MRHERRSDRDWGGGSDENVCDCTCQRRSALDASLGLASDGAAQPDPRATRCACCDSCSFQSSVWTVLRRLPQVPRSRPLCGAIDCKAAIDIGRAARGSSAVRPISPGCRATEMVHRLQREHGAYSRRRRSRPRLTSNFRFIGRSAPLEILQIFLVKLRNQTQEYVIILSRDPEISRVGADG